MRREDRHQVAKGRGAVSNPGGRFEATRLEAADHGWGSLDEEPRRPETLPLADRPRRAITRNASPDVPFDQSVNPYQGCEHGCIYCFARPSHAYWNLGAGLDFETRIFHKPGLAQLLDRELAAPGYECKPINLGANTDPYQPAEREHRTTRALLEVLLAHRHPVTIVTKGALILRDLDLLAALASQRLCSVAVSLTTLDDGLKRTLEPRALAYAPEIAEAMLRRQQASAVVAARHQIVEGAVSIVELALSKLSEKKVLQLDEERKTAMVSNLLVVLCSESAASPVVNTGTLYQ